MTIDTSTGSRTHPPRRARRLGGMTFCLALGTDGVSLVSEAQANTLANAPGHALGAHRAGRHDHDPAPPAPRWAKAR